MFRDWPADITTVNRTGDLRLTATSMTFEKGATFGLRYIREVTAPRPLPEWRTRRFSLFEIVDPRPQELINGYHLCGEPDAEGAVSLARYVAVAPVSIQRQDVLWVLVFPSMDEKQCAQLRYAGRMPDTPPDEIAQAIFDRDWTAESPAAVAVAGDARLTATSITFDGRARFTLRYMVDVTPPNPEPRWGKVRRFSLFEIMNPEPHALRDGVHLCGDPRYRPEVPLPKFLLVGIDREGERDRLLILAFSTGSPARAIERREGLCGELGYFASR